MEQRTVYTKLFSPMLDSKTLSMLPMKSEYALKSHFTHSQYVCLSNNFSQNPVKKIRRNGFIAICTVTVLYILTVVAYYSAGK